MQVQKVEPLKQIIRYEQQLKSLTQKIQVTLLDGNPQQMQGLKDLIAEEEQLIKYLQVESSKLGPQTKQIYTKNISKYKRKSKQHRDYIATNLGAKALPDKSKQQTHLQYQTQNAILAQNKMVMYENQRVQDSMGVELYGQGQKIYGGIEQNREIRKDVGVAEESIRLIKMSILKRKIMFGSLIGLFIGALIFVIIMKIKRD